MRVTVRGMDKRAKNSEALQGRKVKEDDRGKDVVAAPKTG